MLVCVKNKIQTVKQLVLCYCCTIYGTGQNHVTTFEPIRRGLGWFRLVNDVFIYLLGVDPGLHAQGKNLTRLGLLLLLSSVCRRWCKFCCLGNVSLCKCQTDHKLSHNLPPLHAVTTVGPITSRGLILWTNGRRCWLADSSKWQHNSVSSNRVCYTTRFVQHTFYWLILNHYM